MNVVELSEAKEMTLQQLSINQIHRDTRTRAAALLLLGRGIKPKVIAGQLSVSGQSVYNWSPATAQNFKSISREHLERVRHFG